MAKIDFSNLQIPHMKTLLIAILVSISNISIGQESLNDPLDYDTAYKSHNDSTGRYIVKYVYYSRSFTVPATWPPGSPHYAAKIYVYKVVNCRCFFKTEDTVQIGKEITGTYVESGCFEDSPAEYVKTAIKSEMNRNDDEQD